MKLVSRLSFFILPLILSVPVILNLLRPGFFSMYDDMQVIRVSEMDNCIQDGQIPCRWVPNLGYGYGYPLFQYYAPLPYYLMEAVHLLGASFIDSVKVGFILAVVLSGLFFYLFSRSFLSKEGAIAGTVLYLYAPFKAGSLFVRGAMGELWGFFALPFVLWGFEYLLKDKNKLGTGIFAFTIAVFLTTHNLTVLLGAPVVVFWILLRLWKKREKGDVKRALTAILIGGVAPSFYWLPLLIEKNLVYLETLKAGYFNYLSHFLSLKQIFISTVWGYGPSVEGPLDEAFLGLGPVASILGILGILGGLLSKKKEIKTFSVFFGFIFLFSAFLSHSRSTFIWQSLKFMEYLQFPWRFMVLGVLATSVLGGLFISSLKAKSALFISLLLLLTTLGLYGSFYRPKDWFPLTDQEKLSGELLERQLTASIYDYLPKSASKAPDAKAPASFVIYEGKAEIAAFEKGSNLFKGSLGIKEDSLIAVPAYDFPIWEVVANGKSLSTERVGELSLVGFRLERGDYHVKAQLKKTWPRKAGDILTLIGLFSILFLVSYDFIFSKAKKA